MDQQVTIQVGWDFRRAALFVAGRIKMAGYSVRTWWSAQEDNSRPHAVSRQLEDPTSCPALAGWQNSLCCGAGGGRREAEGRRSIFSCPHILQRHILHPGARSHVSLRDSQVRVLGMGWQFLQRWAGQKKLFGIAVRSIVRMRERTASMMEHKSGPARDLPLDGRDLVASSLLRWPKSKRPLTQWLLA